MLAAALSLSLSLLTAAPTSPTLVGIELSNGLPRPPVERAVKMALAKLDRCLAFVANPEKLDARVQVTVNFAREVRAQAALSDPECVAGTVAEWIVEASLLEALSAVQLAGADISSTAFKFSYDFRPSESLRKTEGARLRKSYDVLCRAFNERGLRDPVGTYYEVQPQLEPRWVIAMVPLVNHLRVNSPPGPWRLFANRVREVARSVGIESHCGIFAP